MLERKSRVTNNGRVLIPVQYRRALGLKSGDEVILRLGEGEVRILTRQSAVKQAQSLVRRYVRKGRRLSEELIAERRAEAARE